MIYAIVSIIMKPSKIKFDKKLTMVNHVIANGMFALLIHQSESLKVVVNESPQKEMSTSNQANKQALKSQKQFSVNKNKLDVRDLCLENEPDDEVLGNGYGLDTLITSKYDKLMKQTLLSVCYDEKPVSTTKKKQLGKIRLIPFDCNLLKLPIDIFSFRR